MTSKFFLQKQFKIYAFKSILDIMASSCSIAFASLILCIACGYLECSGAFSLRSPSSAVAVRFARIQSGHQDPVHLSLRGGGALVKTVDTKDEFDSILSSSGDKLVVVDFTAVWCGPCQKIAPVLESLASQYSNVVFLKVSTEFAYSFCIEQ